jgi:nucleoside-diphosphate-sugar epimerase
MEKLYAEEVALAYGRRYPMQVRIARFGNNFGPHSSWNDGREKAPAALCRKVAEVKDGGVIEVWGDGTAVRSYTYIDDLIRGVLTLMGSNVSNPTNIGTDEYVSVAELVDIIRVVSGKEFDVKYVSGPVGVKSRNFSHDRIHSLGWSARYTTAQGIARLYPWIAEQVAKT